MLTVKILFTSLFIYLFSFLNHISAQVGGEVGYILAQKKEAFAARLYIGNEDGDFRIGLGYEQGEFNSKPTERLLPYYSLKLGADYDLFPFNGIPLYFGADFEYLKTTRIIDDSRVSIIPKIGSRLFRVLFIEFSGDNLSEPGDEKRFFDLNLNSIRLTLGLSYYFGYW